MSESGYAISRDQNTADYVLFLPCILVTAALGFSLSVVGELFVLIPAVCIVYAIIARAMPPRLLAAYVVVCLFAGFFSHYRLFPTSWQVAFLDEAIPRQLVPAVSFFCVAWGSKAYFSRKLPSGNMFDFELALLILSLLIAPLFMMHENVSYQGDDSETTALAAYGAFINNILIALFFISGRLFMATNFTRVLVSLYGILVAATTHFLQFRVVTAAVVLMLIGAPPRLVAVAVPAALTAVYAYDMTRIPEAVANNPNKGIRVAFIADAIRSVIDTHGLGIGYGTESVRWVYDFPGSPSFRFMPNPATVTRDRLLELLSRGVHNSFAQAALRTGVVGFALLLCAFFAAFPPPGLRWSVGGQASTLFVIIFVACFVNPALESPVQLVGIGFIYGYLLALRAYAKQTASRALAAAEDRLNVNDAIMSHLGVNTQSP